MFSCQFRASGSISCWGPDFPRGLGVLFRDHQTQTALESDGEDVDLRRNSRLADRPLCPPRVAAVPTWADGRSLKVATVTRCILSPQARDPSRSTSGWMSGVGEQPLVGRRQFAFGALAWLAWALHCLFTIALAHAPVGWNSRVGFSPLHLPIVTIIPPAMVAPVTGPGWCPRLSVGSRDAHPSGGREMAWSWSVAGFATRHVRVSLYPQGKWAGPERFRRQYG